MRSLCIRVHKKDAERIKKILIKNNALNDLKWKKTGDFVIIPIKKKIDGYDLCFDEFEEKKRINRIGSFDIVGDIAIIKFKDDINPERMASEVIKMKNINKVAIDYGVKGNERIRDLKLIIGENLVTIHKEYGIRIKVDISKVYFSPRLAMERWRVTNTVKDGETIFDMFAGCGPFSIMIAKYKKVKIYATDINPHAINYLKENIKINRVNNIEPILGDAREYAKKIKADRIIMNLPHSSFKFLEYAFIAAKHNGMIHYYEILPKDNNREKDIILKAKETNTRIKIMDVRAVHAYSPSKNMYSFLIKVI